MISIGNRPGVTDTLKNPETATSQPPPYGSLPVTTVLTVQQQQAIAQMVLQQQRLQASQQINVQIEHFEEAGETNQVGVNQFKTRWCCPLSVLGFRLNCVPICDYVVLPCIVSQLAGRLRLGKKSSMFWFVTLIFSAVILMGILSMLGFLATGTADLDKLTGELDDEIGEDFGLNYDQKQGTGMFLLICMSWVPMMVVVCLLRGKLRKIRNIEGNQFSDCCLSVFCTQGVVAQIWWELNNSFMRNVCDFSDKA